MAHETFGQRLARLRQRRRLTQMALAQRVGIRQSLLSMLETGERDALRLHVGAAMRLAESLGVSIDYLLRGHSRAQRSQQTTNTHTLAEAPEHPEEHSKKEEYGP